MKQQSNNWYSYVNGDPINNSDPSGYHFGALGLFPGGYASSTAQFGAGLSDFLSNYFKMREAWTKDADKYFHCMANCQATRRGNAGEAFAYVFSEAREIWDYNVKGYTADDCNKDRRANKQGRDGGRRGRSKFCVSIIIGC